MGRTGVQDWLLGPDQPAIRYLTLTELMERKENDPEVVETKKQLTKRGWAAEILSRQRPDGSWVSSESFYHPKYLSTNWMLLILSDLGLTRAEPKIANACASWIKRFAKADGGFASEGNSKGHLCTTGNTARALVKFGYVDDSNVKRSFEWLVKNQAEKGGWSCFGSGRNLDSWEGLSAFAAYPREKWNKSMKLAVEKGAEFYLERELHKQGDHYQPWYRFHYPVHYYYDLLVGLNFMTALGYGNDKRLNHALTVLRERKRPDGRWTLDAIHPDLEGGIAEWYSKHAKHAPTPFGLEKAGAPSKMITLQALAVLKRIDDSNLTTNKGK